MPIYQLGPDPVFPDPNVAQGDGLLAVGGDLSVKRLLEAYRCGIFPWFSEEDPILWWSPPKRAILVPGEEHLSKSLRRSLKQNPFELRIDTAFEAVIRACAQTPRPDQSGTWISPGMIDAYLELHRQGYAHSFESWREGRLVGGLYGLSLGSAFFGESMFSAETNASKIAFAQLCAWLKGQGFTLLDGQLPNENLDRYGFRAVSRKAFLTRLDEALQKKAKLGPWN
jgi:leucyl/phenylalanyl-tRNA---protein transferase